MTSNGSGYWRKICGRFSHTGLRFLKHQHAPNLAVPSYMVTGRKLAPIRSEGVQTNNNDKVYLKKLKIAFVAL